MCRVTEKDSSPFYCRNCIRLERLEGSRFDLSSEIGSIESKMASALGRVLELGSLVHSPPDPKATNEINLRAHTLEIKISRLKLELEIIHSVNTDLRRTNRTLTDQLKSLNSNQGASTGPGLIPNAPSFLPERVPDLIPQAIQTATPGDRVPSSTMRKRSQDDGIVMSGAKHHALYAALKKIAVRPGLLQTRPTGGGSDIIENPGADHSRDTSQTTKVVSTGPRSKERSRPMIGTRTGTNEGIGACSSSVRAREAVVFASRINPSVTASKILQECLGFCPSVSSVRKLKVNHPDSYSSLAITVPFAEVDRLLLPQHWDAGLLLEIINSRTPEEDVLEHVGRPGSLSARMTHSRPETRVQDIPARQCR